MLVKTSSKRLRERRSVRAAIRPIEEFARGSQHLFTAHLELTSSLGERVTVPRFLFAGPGSAGASFLRIGIFGGLHGNEESSVLGAIAFIEQLNHDPELARGYELFIYPICNPTGYANDTRWSRNGADLNRQFWRDSSEPEVVLLERQLVNLAFDGIVALHSDDTSAGVYGFVKGHALTRHVLDPALARAATVLPRNFDKSIDNFQANEGIIDTGYPGVLSAPPAQHPRPLEIIFETPQLSPLDLQVEAHKLVLEEILLRFRATISEAQSI